MGSFKVKLVAYFVLLSLLPLAAAFWGFSTVAARGETRRVDARLQAGLRATVAAFVFPSEVMAAPHISPAITAASLLRTALEAIPLAARIRLGGGWLVEHAT